MASWSRLVAGTKSTRMMAMAAVSITSGTLLYQRYQSNGIKSNDGNDGNAARSLAAAAAAAAGGRTAAAGARVAGLPQLTRAEVRLHDGSPESGARVWVSYGHGVYDITEFVPRHPGSASNILMAAGGPLEPFWDVYAVHKESSHVHALLEACRIGNLSEEEAMQQRKELQSESVDPFLLEPATRHPSLVRVSRRPFNAETPLSLLTSSFITPNELFYVRNHLATPLIDEKEYVLEVSNAEGQSVELSLDDLRSKLATHSVVATVQCGGNRRLEMAAVKPIKGLEWQGGAIGNAKWTGVRLRDVLALVNFDMDIVERQGEKEWHVQFEGADLGADGSAYGASVPAEIALGPDVLLAFEMNDQPLPRDHGAPLRVIVPGVVGARHVKWLKSVAVANEESGSHWQRNDYKVFSPSVDWNNVDFTKASAIQKLPVTSKICSVNTSSDTNDGSLEVRGYAFSGGGNRVSRVDLSLDQGEHWIEAELVAQDQSREPRHYAWTLWRARLDVPEDQSVLELWSKAVDSSCNTQPMSPAHIWNLRGMANNAYSKVKIQTAQNGTHSITS